MQAVWLQVGGESAAATVKTVWMPLGNWNAKLSAVTQGVCRQEPEAPPQSASLLHGCSALTDAFVMQIFGPVTPRSL